MKIVKKKMITNDKTPKTIYGHKIQAIDGNVNALSHFNNDMHLNNGKTQIRMELIRTNLPEKRDAIKYTYSKNGVSSFEIKPLLAVRDDDAFDSEEKLIRSFERLRLLKDIKGIFVRDLLDGMCKRFRQNVRYAYKEIEQLFDKNKQYSVYIYHIIVLFIASISFLNDVDFMPPIRISVKSNENTFTLAFMEKTENASTIYKNYSKEPLSKIETKLSFIASLCREDDIDSRIVINNSSISMEFKLTSAEITRGTVYSSPEMEDKVFNEYMELFNYTEKAEEEEE